MIAFDHLFSSLESIPEAPDRPKGRWWIAAGIFLLVLAIYILSSPGRIDMIDGQVRYEAALNWILEGRPALRDPAFARWSGVRGRGGVRYSHYGAGGSLAALPLVWLGTFNDDPPGEFSRFLFSLTSVVFGAFVSSVLFLFYLELGLATQSALAWTMAGAFATLLWPSSASVFDNAQHTLLMLLTVYLGHRSSIQRSNLLAACAGLVAGALIMYQEYFLLVIPALAVSTLYWPVPGQPSEAQRPPLPLSQLLRLRVEDLLRTAAERVRTVYQATGEGRRSLGRYAILLAAACVSAGLSLAYNYFRFGSFFHTAKAQFAAQRGYPLFGDPFAGFLTLLLSPGKSIFLYSPLILLGLLGLKRFIRQRLMLGISVVASSSILVLFVSCIAFAGGDWCWGPRYLVPLLPLWALAFPFVSARKFRRPIVAGLLGAGLAVQLLALSVENQRFFFERGLADFFWAEDSWFYFKHSALVARIGEVASLKDGVPQTAKWFNQTRDQSMLTYTILGPPIDCPRRLAPIWIRNFKLYYLPRPWPIWMWTVKPEQRPINLEAWLGGVLGLAILGCACIAAGMQAQET